MTGALLASESNNPFPPIVLIAPLNSSRASAFKTSMNAQGLGNIKHITYLELINESVQLMDIVTQGCIVRIESSGGCIETEKALLTLGWQQLLTQKSDYWATEDIQSLALERGQIMPSDQWYQGFSAFLFKLSLQLQQCPTHQCTINIDHTLMLFDKRQTSQIWRHAHINVPDYLPSIRSFDALEDAMKRQNIKRVFIKLAHGSCASGAIALEVNNLKTFDRIRAATSVIFEPSTRTPHTMLFNSKKINYSVQKSTIVSWVNHLAQQHPLQVEHWLPKPRFADYVFDMRVVVCNGVAQHFLARLGTGPVTNLHLGNIRGNVNDLRVHLGESSWQQMIHTAEAAAACFKHSLYVGLDLLYCRKHWYVLEGNAFGDFHQGITNTAGRDTYTQQIFSLYTAQQKTALHMGASY